MRILIIILTILAFLYSGFMLVVVFFGSGLSGCHTGDPCATEIQVYVGSSLIMVILSLTGLIGMGKSLNDYSTQQFSMFAIIGFLIPLIMYFFVRSYNTTKNKENSYENVMNKYYPEHCLNMPNSDGTRYWSCDDGRTYPIK